MVFQMPSEIVAVSRGGQRQRLANYLGSLQRLPGQLAVGVQDHGDGFLQVCPRFRKSRALCVRAGQFFNQRDVAFGDLHVHSCESHLEDICDHTKVLESPNTWSGDHTAKRGRLQRAISASVAPHSPGLTSRTCFEKSQWCPSRSSAAYWRSP